MLTGIKKDLILNIKQMDDRLDKMITHMMEYGTSGSVRFMELKKNVSDKLYIYQYQHLISLLYSFRLQNVVLDGSDTGTGKTYTTVALCKQLNLKPFIICPKAVLSTWKNVCDFFKVEYIGVTSYESAKNCKQYDGSDRVESPYIQKMDNKYCWQLPKHSILVFDEVHRCKNKNSVNGKLLMSAKNKYQKIIMLSATVSDTPEHFHIFGYMLDIYSSIKQAKNWVDGTMREDMSRIDTSGNSCINQEIYPRRGARMVIKDIGEQFPKNQISVDCYYVDKEDIDTVNSCFENIRLLKCKPSDNNDHLGKIVKARQKVENVKIPLIVELIHQYMDNGCSVVVFVNFLNTAYSVAKKIKTNCMIVGEQTSEEREQCIEDFQTNKSRVIVCTVQAGSEGISLHDKYGVPRVSIISPPFSSVDLTQALGRIYRAGSLSPAVQRIVYCAGTCEEAVCRKVKNKIKFTADINDCDLFF